MRVMNGVKFWRAVQAGCGQRGVFCGHGLVAAGATETRLRVKSAGAAKLRVGRKKVETWRRATRVRVGWRERRRSFLLHSAASSRGLCERRDEGGGKGWLTFRAGGTAFRSATVARVARLSAFREVCRQPAGGLEVGSLFL